MKLTNVSAIAALVVLMWSMPALPAYSQQSDCTQVDGAQPTCGLKPHQIDGLKDLLQKFEKENKSPNAVPNANAGCVSVDHFKPVCGLMAPQLSEFNRQLDEFKSQNAQ